VKKPAKKSKWAFKNEWKRKYKTPESMYKAVVQYFDGAVTPTMSGLALALGFKAHKSIWAYAKQKGFEDVVAYTRLRMEEVYEKRLHDKNCTGAIFALKNMGWKDSQSMELGGPGGEPLPPIQVTVIRGNRTDRKTE